MRKWIAAILGGLVQLSAAASGTATVSSVPTATINAYGMTLEFPESMQTWANAISPDLIRFAPPVASKCSWIGDSELQCSFGDLKLPLATAYDIHIGSGLITRAGAEFAPLILHAETDRPTLGVYVMDWKDGLPQLFVRSSDQADTGILKKFLHVRLDGTDVPVDLRPIDAKDSWSDDRRFALVLPPLSRTDTMIEVSVAPGLPSMSGPLAGIQQELLFNGVANESFHLREATCQGHDRQNSAIVRPGPLSIQCHPDEPIRFGFSEAPDPDALLVWASRLGSHVKYLGSEIRSYYPDQQKGKPAASPTHDILVSVDQPNSSRHVIFPAGFRGSRSGLESRIDMLVRTQNFRPQLRARYARNLLRDGKSAGSLAQAVNAPATRINIRAFDSGTHAESMSTSRPGGSKPREIRSEITSNSLDNGGWVRWKKDPGPNPPESDAWLSRPIEFAAPDFDLLAVAGRRQLVVWANDWDSNAGVGMASVELLNRASADAIPKLISSALTSADGVALLDVAEVPGTGDRVDPGDPAWLIRATLTKASSSQRSVLPVDYYASGLLGQKAPVSYWGVTDRPLYRAGDKVRYRLWRREKTGGRYLHVADAPPVTLSLHDTRENKDVITWQAQAGGVIHGELDLPAHLADDEYCIGPGEQSGEGACFYAGTFRAQDLWVEVATPDKVLRDGETLVVDIASGYYSGGPAAGVAVSNTTTLLTGLPVEQAYPEFSAFRFIDVMNEIGSGGIEVDSDRTRKLLTDRDGKAQVSLPLIFSPRESQGSQDLPAFGRIRFVTEVRLNAREGTVSSAAKARYARYERYVGLRSIPDWPDDTKTPLLEGVVVSAEGQRLPDTDIDVEIRFRPEFKPNDEATEVLARCTLPAGKSTPCPFPRKQSGWYVMSATATHAAATQLTRYIAVRGDPGKREFETAALTVVRQPKEPGSPFRALLEQPFQSAKALVILGRGDTILEHRVMSLHARSTMIELVPPKSGGGNMTMRVWVRENAAASQPDASYRMPPKVLNASVEIEIPAAESMPGAIAASFDRISARPGETVRLSLQNRSSQARELVVAVMDDAIRALAGDWLSRSDPNGFQWLGGLDQSYLRLGLASFEDWNKEPWIVPLSWPHRPGPGLATQTFIGRRQVDIETVNPVVTLNPAKTLVDAASSDGTSERLDTIVVTGSNIRAVDIFYAGPDPVHGVRQRAGESMPMPGIQARTRFADTALWLPDIRLQPGESRTFDVVLPDNLTRWRTMVWSSDKDDDFDMTDAAIETGLPLEVRLQAPVRLFEGDRSELTANVHQTRDGATKARVSMLTEGKVLRVERMQDLPLPSRGQNGFAMSVAPTEPGQLITTATAQARSDGDAVVRTTEVASASLSARKIQAGWIESEPIQLQLPVLPESASDVHLNLSVYRGDAGLIERWTTDLRDYPHRCWEQILSRAVAAALAIHRGDTEDWPDAADAVREALDNSGVFQGENGDFRYFANLPAGPEYWEEPEPQIALTAYTLDVFGLLRTLGHAAPANSVAKATNFLHESFSGSLEHGDALEDAATALAALDDPGADQIRWLWKRWDEMSLSAQVSAASALAKARHPRSADSVRKLLLNAPLRANARTVGQFDAAEDRMSSPMREQCRIIQLVSRNPDLVDPAIQRELRAGLSDLYSGGVVSVDTQTAAHCLMAVSASAPDPLSASAQQVDVQIGNSGTQLQIPVGADKAFWKLSPAADDVLNISRTDADESPLSYVAELEYKEDARTAADSAIGLSLERDYEVLRAGKWVSTHDQTIHEGDWLRITLRVVNGATRHFVALTDSLPGGFLPTDLNLSGVAGLDIETVSDPGSHWFNTRKLDPRSPRFYAEALPPGRHEIHYFARAGNSGDYLGAPAQAELMYGNTSRARTAASRIRIN
jgi:hypothetical protein